MKYLLLIASLSLASSCQKENMSADGHKNIFRCKVNGVEWTPHCISDFFGCSAVDCQYYKGTQTIEITCIKRDKASSVDQGMRLYRYNSAIGINELQYSSKDYSDYLNESGCISYGIDTNFVKRLTIFKIDTLNYTISGTFEFTVLNQCSDTVRITDGYFDVEYRF